MCDEQNLEVSTLKSRRAEVDARIKEITSILVNLKKHSSAEIVRRMGVLEMERAVLVTELDAITMRLDAIERQIIEGEMATPTGVGRKLPPL